MDENKMCKCTSMNAHDLQFYYSPAYLKLLSVLF